PVGRRRRTPLHGRGVPPDQPLVRGRRPAHPRRDARERRTGRRVRRPRGGTSAVTAPARVIDAHHHLWDRRRADYPWLGPHLPLLDREVLFEELAPLLERAGVTATVLVQGADNDADTDFLLEQAAAHDAIAAVVAWIPLDDPTRAARRL